MRFKANQIFNRANKDFSEMLNDRILIDYERAKMLKEGKMPNPRFAILYISNSCNQNCQYCEYVEENKGGFLPTKKALDIINQLADLGIKAVEFSGGGEPLIHPDIIKILNYCKEKDIVVGVISNLSTKNDKLMETIINVCSYIRASTDSFDPTRYNEIRRPKMKECSFSQLESNLKKLVKLKKSTGSGINIGVKRVISKLNHDKMEDFIKGAIRLGVDNVQFKKVYLNKDLEIGNSDEFSIEKISGQLTELKKKYEKEIDIFFGFYDLKLQCRCFMNINHIFIDAHGDVYLCCHYLKDKESLKLGSTSDQSIKDIWFSKRHWEVIKNTKPEECNKVDCRWIKYTNLMKPFVDDNERQLDFI